MRLKIGAYVRVSTEEQAQVYEGSLESQKYLLKQHVETKNKEIRGWGEIVEFFVDDGYSAKDMNRPAFQKMLGDIRKKKINLILITDLSRLSRNLNDFCQLSEDLKELDANFISLRQQFLDTSTPGGRMMVHMMVNLGQFEREQTAERVSINFHARSMRGLVNGGKAVLGFSRHPEKPGTLVVNKEEAEIVRTIFKTFLECGTRAKTIKRLHELRVYPKRRMKSQDGNDKLRWSVQTLGNLLHQWTYIGQREINKQHKHEDQTSLKPWQRYSVAKSSWPAIVDEKVFNEAQRLLGEAWVSERARLEIAEDRVFVLSGQMTCGECGRALVGKAAHNRMGELYKYYHHSRKFHVNPCNRPWLRADLLEKIIFEGLVRAVKTAGYFDDLEKRLKKVTKEQRPQAEKEIKRVSTTLQEIEERIAGIWSFQRNGKLTPEALELASNELNSLAKEKATLRAYLTQLGDSKPDEEEIRDQVEFVKTQMRDVVKGWQKANPTLKKRLIRRLIRSIVVTRKEIKVTFWLAEQGFGNSNSASPKGARKGTSEVLQFSDFSSSNQDQNGRTACSPLRKNGSGEGN